MMKKRISLAVLYVAAVCLLCCGCGEKGSTLLIASAEKQTEENSLTESVQGNASVGLESPEQEADTVIRVYVCGAVAEPGVVDIAPGSRVEDALTAAGGFAAEAAREAVNLADWVSDGQKLYFPAQGEEIQPGTETDSASGLVNINTADSAALCTLPGVGESRAADIIAWREANGGFDSCEDIMKVSGIKTALYEKIRDMIRVD